MGGCLGVTVGLADFTDDFERKNWNGNELDSEGWSVLLLLVVGRQRRSGRLPPTVQGEIDERQWMVRQRWQKRCRAAGLVAAASCNEMADLAVDATLTSSGRFSAVRGEGVDSHPQQREDGRKKNGPDDDDSRSAVLPAQQTFEERVQVHNHPNGEEQSPEQRAPRLIPAVYGE
nr:hypothetical protein DM860_001194 [Ipomoea batatas]